MWIHVITNFSKSIKCLAPRMSPNINNSFEWQWWITVGFLFVTNALLEWGTMTMGKTLCVKQGAHEKSPYWVFNFRKLKLFWKMRSIEYTHTLPLSHRHVCTYISHTYNEYMYVHTNFIYAITRVFIYHIYKVSILIDTHMANIVSLCTKQENLFRKEIQNNPSLRNK